MGRPVPLVIMPAVTVMSTVSAVYRVMTRLLLPDTVAVPVVKKMAVVVPKFFVVPLLLVTVGWPAFGLVLAPAKVKLLETV